MPYPWRILNFLKIFILYFILPDDSDAPTGLVAHLPRRLLGEHAEKRKRKRASIGNRDKRLEADSNSDSDTEETVRRDIPRQWTRQDPKLVGSKVPPFEPVVTSEDSLKDLSSAYDFYKLFQPNTFVEEIVYQSKLYGVQKSKTSAVDIVNIDTYRYLLAYLYACVVDTVLQFH